LAPRTTKSNAFHMLSLSKKSSYQPKWPGAGQKRGFFGESKSREASLTLPKRPP
jgi:hypothetical protein